MLRRLYRSRRVRRFVRWSLILGGTGFVLSLAVFYTAALVSQRDFRPVQEAISADLAAHIDAIPNYRREESSTYLTFTEWYLVFNPQEYAAFIAKERPSQFAYFRGVGQIWRGYNQTYAVTRRHYPFNGGANLMVAVIGASSTFEFGIKGAYEKTVGRVFEWTASARTPEDEFAARVAREYGEFIPTKPWFEFSFGDKFCALWSSHDFFGPNFLRKSERKFFLSLEYGMKYLYAAAMRAGSHAVYGVAETEVYLSAHDVTPAALARPGVRGVKEIGPGHWILAVPHYQGFTDTVPLLARDGVRFNEVCGNDEIMLTLHAPVGWKNQLSGARTIFEMALLNTAAEKRVALQVPIKSLGAVLREMEAAHLRLEHLFDY